MTENPLKSFFRPDIPGRFNEAALLGKHRERLSRVLNGEELPPYEIIIHPSSGCNLNCQWCIGGGVLEERDLDIKSSRLSSTLEDPEIMGKVIQDVINYKKGGFSVERVSFSGITGEPLRAKESFIKAVGLLTDNGIRAGIFSNAELIDPGVQETLLKMDYINASLDAATPATWAQLKYNGRSAGKNKFEQIINNITSLAQARDELGSALQINASFILYPSNYTEIYAAAKLFKGFGVNTLRIKQDISGTRLLTPEQRVEAESSCTRVMRELVDDRFRFVEIHPPDMLTKSGRSFSQCRITELWGAIGSDGNVYACNYNACVGGVPPYGNAIEQSFQEVWEGDTRRRIKQQLPNGCPSVCDPFKGRANALLSAINDSIQEFGYDQTQNYIDEIIGLVQD